MAFINKFCVIFFSYWALIISIAFGICFFILMKIYSLNDIISMQNMIEYVVRISLLCSIISGIVIVLSSPFYFLFRLKEIMKKELKIEIPSYLLKYFSL